MVRPFDGIVRCVLDRPEQRYSRSETPEAFRVSWCHRQHWTHINVAQGVQYIGK